MKSTALHRFRLKLQANEPVYGLWVTLEAAAVSDIAAGLGFDWIVIDAAHGHLDWAEVLEHIRATARSETVALVRLPGVSPELIKRALDLGADGVLISGSETADQLQSIVEKARASHNPSGQPSANDTEESDASVFIVPVVNLERDEPRLREMSSIEGVDFFFFELQASSAPSSASMRAKQDAMLVEIRNHGKHAGIVGESDEALREYQEREFRVLGVGPDAAIIRRGIQSTLEAVEQATKSRSRLDGNSTQPG
ncbi:MAG: aldolase/citrate lyase family protein [Terriglobales bacterium]